MKSSDSPHSQLSKLQGHGLRLRQSLDQSQAVVSDLNSQIRSLSEAGLVHEVFLVGDAFYAEPYEGIDDADIGKAFVSTLSTPSGFGAAVWDTEEYFQACRQFDPVESVSRERNVLFAELSPRAQAQFLIEVQALMDRFLIAIGAKPVRPKSQAS
ncbi:hypothetical protein [Anatilimnocola floriformis]|uniref:hypothetical protein n=1 Tax=Anatilimnocola floriformis TaxID=2948575 RepID=UPI0020C38E94|nr:hypothetical protein [Anatilimnocola floriformis]